jgi:hypothetical protein
MSQCVARADVLGLDAGDTRSGVGADEDAGDTEHDSEPGLSGPSSGEPDACSVDGWSESCDASAEPCEELDFDRIDGVCTKRDDCAGVSSCDPGDCVDGVRTYTCSCPPGSVLQGKACLPGPECAKLECSQRCVSQLAKPTCACDGELVLASDGKSCKSGAWSEPVVISEAGSMLGGVALAVSRTGPAMLLFQQNVSGVLELSARPFRNNAWQAASQIERSAHDGHIDIAIDDFGRSTAIYERSDTTGRHQFWGYYANATWNLRQLVDGSVSGLEHPSDSEGLQGVKIVASGLGHVYGVWRHVRKTDQGETAAVYIQELPLEKTTTARLLAPDSSWLVNDIDVSVENTGIAAATWMSVMTETEAPRAMIDSFQDRAWTGPRPVDLGGAVGAPALRASLASPGHTTHITWVSNDGVYHRELAPDGTPTELVAPLTGQPGLFLTSTAAGRSLTVLWTEVLDGNSNLRAITKSADSAWSEPSAIHTTAGQLVPLRVLSVSDGSAVILWLELQGTGFVAYLSHSSPAAETWSAPMKVNSEGTFVGDADVGMDEGHRIMLVWSQRPTGGTTTRIFVRRFE